MSKIKLISLLLSLAITVAIFSSCTVPDDIENTTLPLETILEETSDNITEETSENESETESITEIIDDPVLEGENAELIRTANQLANTVQAYFEDAKWHKYIVENNNLSYKYVVSKDLPQYMEYIKNSQGVSYIENTMDVFVKKTDGYTVFASSSSENALVNMFRLGYYYDEVRFEGQDFADGIAVHGELPLDITKHTAINSLSTPASNSDDSISFSIRGGDAHIVFDRKLDIPTDVYNYVQITMKSEACQQGTLYIIAGGKNEFGSQYTSFDIIPDGEYHTYTIKLSSLSDYTDSLTGFRLDFDKTELKEKISISEISFIEGEQKGINNIYLANIFHTYSDKLHYEMQLAVSEQVNDIAEIGVKTEILADTVYKLTVSDALGVHDSLESVDWSTATYVGFDIKDAGIFGLILPVHETTGTIKVTLEDEKYVVIYSRTPENNTILPGDGNPQNLKGASGNTNDFYMGYRIYTDESHDFEGLATQAYIERNPLSAKNIKVSTAYSDNGTFNGYDSIRGSYMFSLSYNVGKDNLERVNNFPNRHYALNFSVKSDEYERLMYFVVDTKSSFLLECSALLDQNLMMLPVPIEVGKNFGSDGDENIFDLLDLGYSEAIMPIIATSDVLREYTVLHLYENWGDFPLKQLSFIEYTCAYYHLSLGSCESNCFVPWGWTNNRAIPNMLPDHRGASGTEWPGSNTHTQSGNHSFFSYSGSSVEELTGQVIDSYGPTYVDLTLYHLTEDGKIKTTRRHIEQPQEDENRSYCILEYEALEDITIKNVRDSLQFYSTGSNEYPNNYRQFGYLDENNESRIVSFSSISGTQIFKLGDHYPYFSIFDLESVLYGNVSMLIDSYEVMIGGKKQDIDLAIRVNEGYIALTLDTDEIKLKKGDKIVINAIIMPWGSEETDYSGEAYAPDQNVRDVRENTLINPITVTAVENCNVIDNLFVNKLKTTNGKTAEFTISGGKKNQHEIKWRHEGNNVAVRIYGFDKLSVPIVYELIDGEWVKYDISSIDNPDKLGYCAYYDGYNVYYDADGTYSYSFVIDMTEGVERQFKIELDESFEKFHRIMIDEADYVEETPFKLYLNSTGFATRVWKGWFGNVTSGAEDGVSYTSLYPNSSKSECIIEEILKNTEREETGQYLVVKYRIPTENENNDKMRFQFFASTEHGVDSIKDPDDVFNVQNELIIDGDWHVFVIDLSSFNKKSIQPNDNGAYILRYMRFDVFNAKLKTDTNRVDIAYFAMHNSLDEILAFNADMGEITLITGNGSEALSTAIH